MTRILLLPFMLAVILILVTPLLSCRMFHRRFDRKGLEKLALSMTERFEPGTPQALDEYLRTLDPKEKSAPPENVRVRREALVHWNLAHRVEGEIEEIRISFPGRTGAALLLEVSRHELIDRANLMIPVVDWSTIITGEICGEICI